MNGQIERWAARNPDVRYPLLIVAVFLLCSVPDAVASALGSVQ